MTWRWCFYVNIPFQGVAFLIFIFYFKIYRPRTPLRSGLIAIDWSGVVLIVGAVITFLLGLQLGGVAYPWQSAPILCLMIFGVFMLGLFAVNEWKVARYPLIPIHIFGYRSNIACLVVCFCHGFVYIGGSFYLPLYFQAVLGYSSVQSGALLLASVVSLSLFSIISGLFVRKTGQYLPCIWFGMTVLTIGFGLYLNLGISSGVGQIIGYQIVGGVGIGLLFQALLIALQSLVSPADLASAVAAFQLTRNTATSMSVVVGSVMFQNAMNKRMSRLVDALGPVAAAQLAGFQAAASVEFVRGLPQTQKTVAATVIAESLHEVWIVYVAVAGFGLISSFAITKQILAQAHEETKTGLEFEETKRQERLERRNHMKSSRRGYTSRGGQNQTDVDTEIVGEDGRSA